MSGERTRAESFLLIVSGPAGSGKTTVCEALLREFGPGLQRAVTATSRAPRGKEKDGVDYHFFSPEAFEEAIRQGRFFEHARVHGRHYGVLKEEVLGKLEARVDLLLNIDVQGAATFRQAEREEARLRGRVVSVFLMPDSLDQLRGRLRGRGQDGDEEIERRLRTALEEVRCASAYDYVVRSGTREADYDRLRAVYLAETLRTGRQRIESSLA